MQNKIKSFFNKTNSINIVAKSAMWFTICNLVQKTINMITLPIFTRLLTTEQYGVFSIYNSWYNIIKIIVTLNLSGSLINNGLLKYEGKQDRFISSVQGLSTTVTIIFFAIYLVAMDFWNGLFELSSVFMLTMFIQLLFEPAYLYWCQKQRYEYKYKGLLITTVIISVTSPVLGVIAVLSTEYKAEARVIAFALVQICIGLVFYIIQAKKGKNFFDKNIWKYALAFNLPLIPHYFSQMIMGQADRIMISRMVGNSEAAIYSVSCNISAAMTMFVNALNSSFTPYLYKNLSKNKYDGIKTYANRLCLFMAVIVVIFMLFGPEVIFIFSSSDYMAAKWVFPLLSASVYFTFINLLYLNIEFYYEKTNYTMIVSILYSVLNIILNYFFITEFGYISASYTTLICHCLIPLSHFLLIKYIMKKKSTLKDVFNNKYIFGCSLAVLAATLITTLLYSHNIIRYIIIGIIAIIALFNYKKILLICKQTLFK